MTPIRDSYTDTEWAEAVAGAPLSDLSREEVGLLHRQWMWANQQRERFYELMPEEDKEAFTMMFSRGAGHMLAWYGFLWTVIEAFEARTIKFGGAFQDDIDSISDDLRRLRNAVFHVPDAGKYHDERLVKFIGRQDSVELVRRVHGGFGRLFIEFMREPKAAN